MPETIALSEAAVAVLRLEIKGYRPRDQARRLPAYRELSAAGIMEPVPGPQGEITYRFAAADLERREEILAAAEARLRDLQPRLPDRIELSAAAQEVLRLRIAGGRVEVTPDNLEAHRELARVGILEPVSTFRRGPESVFRFTDQGWSRREEWLARPAESP